jgi:hypothetical protein
MQSRRAAFDDSVSLHMTVLFRYSLLTALFCALVAKQTGQGLANSLKRSPAVQTMTHNPNHSLSMPVPHVSDVPLLLAESAGLRCQPSRIEGLHCVLHTGTVPHGIGN